MNNAVSNVLGANSASQSGNSSPRNGSQNPTSALPVVQSIFAISRSCNDPNAVIQNGNTIIYMGNRYAIPAGSPIVNWTPDAVRRYIIPFQTPIPPTQQITNNVYISSDDRVQNGVLNILGGLLYSGFGSLAMYTALSVACPPAALALALGLGGGALFYGASMAAEGWNDIQLARQGDTVTVAFNPVRDTVFDGNQGVYDLIGFISMLGSMGVVYSYPELYGRSNPTSSGVQYLNHKASSGVELKTTPGKTTTVLGRMDQDTRAIISELNLSQSTDFSGNPGGFNLLNISPERYGQMGADAFWETYNKPFLDAAIQRDDIILMATPVNESTLYISGTTQLTVFGREYFYLLDQGYKYVDGQMIK